MTLYHAKKIVITTERIIAKGVCEIIDQCGATGYTLIAAGGKGSRNMRSTSERASVVEDFGNIIIEVIVNDDKMAEEIMEKVAAKYFHNYSGIAHLENVSILRPTKF